MIRFLLGMVFGGSLGFVWAALLSGGNSSDTGETIIVRHETADTLVPRKRAFKPADNFLNDCPQVCGNCAHWEKELYAWGNVQVCRVCGQPRNCGRICDVYEDDYDG